MNNQAKYEILGVGTPLIDLILPVEESFLDEIAVKKSGIELFNYEALLNIIQQSGRDPILIAGGSGANTIKGLANFGRACALVGKIGEDPFGKKFLQSIKSLGIVPLYQFSQTPTAQVLCLVTPDGERTFCCYQGAGEEMRAEDLDPVHFKEVKLVHIEGYSLLNEDLTQKAMELAKEAGAKISFDLASHKIVRQHKEKIISLITNYVDIVFANASELEALTQLNPEKGCNILKDICETVVVLIGREGSILGQGEKQIHMPSLSSKGAVDTTGAGDLYASGFLHGYLEGKPLATCAHYGSLAAAAVIQVFGAEIPAHSWEEIKSKIDEL